MELVARQLVERWKLKQIIQKSAKGRRKFSESSGNRVLLVLAMWIGYLLAKETDTDLHVP